MRATNLNIGVIAIFFVLGAAASTDSAAERTGKHFSLFSVVTFKNEECTSESSLTGGARQGTCYTTTECSDKDGLKSGNCASGFGVCCIFLQNSGASATVSENRTYLRNSEYPAVAAATAAVSIAYTLQKMSSDICQIRLDFVDFVIAGPANTDEAIVAATSVTHCNADTLTFAQTGGAQVPTLCGFLGGEHLYLDLGMAAADTSVVTIGTAVSTTIGPATANRLWDIKTSQIECFATYRAPQGCHRYFTTSAGKIISYNFHRVTGTTPAAQATAAGQNTGIELAFQSINTCIRRAKGMCCVEYQVCQAFNGILLTDAIGVGAAGANNGVGGIFNEGFSIDLDTTPFVIDATQGNVGMTDGQCSSDYIEIPSSWSAACGVGFSSARSLVNSRYCGSKLGFNGWLANIAVKGTPVCDCSEPFVLRHGSDSTGDGGGSGQVANGNENSNVAMFPRGFCVDFKQQQCAF